jgi:hypothetical protein
MSSFFSQNRTNILIATIATICVASSWFFLTWRWGFDFADEGFLWYGAQHTLQGEVPLRDFYSYDVGRYYWAATIMYLIGSDGPFAVRLSAAIYQSIGTLLGVIICLLALQRKGAVQWLFAFIVAFIITLWAKPYYKVYDHTSSIVIISMLIILIRSSRPTTWLLAGICLGTTAVIGRNHGLYGTLSFLIILSMKWIYSPARKEIPELFIKFAVGVLIGYSPMLIMMLAHDGFASAFMQSIIAQFKMGSTNITLPIPWPWLVSIGTTNISLTMQMLAVGFGYILLLAFPLVGIVVLAREPFVIGNNLRVVALATTVASIPYAHYSFSRADVTHLSLGIFPALIGLISLSSLAKGARPVGLALLLLFISIITIPPAVLHRIIQKNWVLTEVAGEQLWIRPDLSEKLSLIKELLSNSGTNNFLAIPNMPSIHAIYHTKMSIYDIYPITTKDDDFELHEINRLQVSLPKYILLSDRALDDNIAYRFSQLRPSTYNWIISNYDRISSLSSTDIAVFSAKR